VKTKLRPLIRGSDIKVVVSRCLVKVPKSHHIQLISIPRASVAVSLRGEHDSPQEAFDATHVSKTHKERRTTMPLLQAVEILVVLGVLLWLVNRFIPMQSSIKSVLNGVVVIAVVVWLLNAFGVFHSLSRMHVGS
jgi:hypothetical protein